MCACSCRVELVARVKWASERFLLDASIFMRFFASLYNDILRILLEFVKGEFVHCDNGVIDTNGGIKRKRSIS